jgi:cell division septum initiation protein DivIVA
LVCELYDSLMGETNWAAQSYAGEREELYRRIEKLEADLSRSREKEQLLVSTLGSATSHARAIRESARRDAERILRKAGAKAQKKKAAVVRARRDEELELLRLRRITEQMRTGLASFLTGKLEELHVEAGQEQPIAQPTIELERALESVVEARSKNVAASDPEPDAKLPGEDERRPTYGSEHDLRFR